MILNLLILAGGVLACSTAVIVVKVGTLDPRLVAAGRLLFATILLMPLFLQDLRKQGWRSARDVIKRSVAPGLLLGLHFLTWIAGARMTAAANSSVIVNMMPVAMPFFLFVLYRERLNRFEALGTALAVAGVWILARGDFALDIRSFKGDMLCLGSMLLLAWYLALARKSSGDKSLWLYVVPLYLVGGILCLIVALLPLDIIGMPRVDFAALRRWEELGLVVTLAIIPTICGHTALNYSMRQFRGQIVAVVNLGQFMFASVMAYYLLADEPHPAFYLACLPLVSGALIVILASPPRSPPVPLAAAERR